MLCIICVYTMYNIVVYKVAGWMTIYDNVRALSSLLCVCI